MQYGSIQNKIVFNKFKIQNYTSPNSIASMVVCGVIWSGRQTYYRCHFVNRWKSRQQVIKSLDMLVLRNINQERSVAKK